MPDDVEFDDLDTEDDADENQAPADLVVGDTGFPDEEEIEVQVADAEPETGDKEAKGEDGESEEVEGKHKRPNRLQRERRRVREERQRANEEHQRADAAEAEIQRLRAENATLAARPAKEAGSDDDIDREIQAKTKRFREVRSQFDPAQADEEAELIRDLAALELRKERKKAEADRGAAEQRPVQQPAPKPHRNVQAWLDDNDWFDDPKYEKETRRARAIDAQVSADGYRPEDEDYFEEVERRMEVAGIKIPGRKKQEANGSNGASRKEGTVAGRVDVPTGGKHSVILTRDDLATLEKLGQNVKDKKVLEEYARNKRREEQRAG